MSIKPELFEIENESEWKDYLEQEGYVVLKNILSKERKEEYFKLFVKDWNYVSPNFDFHNKSTWTIDNSPMMWNKGMIYSSGLGQSDFQWALRTDERIISIWEKVHETKNLVVSYDGFSVFLSKKQKPKIWLHVDQNHKDKIYSIQGAYNFLPVTDESAGFIVVPKSHKTYNIDIDKKKQFIPIELDNEHVKKAVKLLIPENCFVLWNSKTIHANIGMSNKIKDNLNRLTSYITYFPKANRSEEILKKRIEGYKNGDNCGHFAIRHNIKKHPYGLKSRYEAREFNNIIPYLDEEGNIPQERLKLI